MTINRAYNITRNFQKDGIEFIPGLITNGFFCSSTNNTIDFCSFTSEHFSYFNISKKEFKTNFLDNHNFHISDEEFNEDLAYSIQKPIGEYAITSIGLITMDEFYLAQDFIEKQQKIKKTNMEFKQTYLSNKGKKYIFLGDLLSNYGTNIIYSLKDCLFDISLSKIVKLNSIKLIEEINNDYYYTLDSFFNCRTYLSYSNKLSLKEKI